MTRQEIYREMQESFGLVPSFFEALPDDVLEHDWNVFKVLEGQEGTLGLKEKNLIGLGIAAAIKCRYCTLFHTEMARAHGASDEEIHEALRYAMNTAGWSTFLNGIQLDFEKFKNELFKIQEYVGKKAEKEAARMAM